MEALKEPRIVLSAHREHGAGASAATTSNAPRSYGSSSLRVVGALVVVCVVLFGVAVTTSSSHTIHPVNDTSARLRDRHQQQQHEYARRLQADDAAACAAAASSSPFATYLTAIPETGGLRTCVAANINDLVASLSATGSTCSLSTLITLFTSTTDSDANAFMEFFNALLAGLSTTTTSGSASSTTTTAVSASAFLSTWSKNATKTQGFCNAMNSKVGPCVQTLVPALLAILKKGPKCCSTLTGYFDVVNLVVPAGKSMEQTLYDIVNGVHKTMCTVSGSDTLCGQTLIDYLSSTAASSEAKSLLSSVLFTAGLPLYVLPDSGACASLDAKTIASRVTAGASIPYFAYSCCSAGLVSLLEAVDDSLSHLFGNTVPEMLNLITAKQNLEASEQFTSFYEEIKACSFEQKCTNPSFLLPSNAGTATEASSAAVAAKTAQPQDVACTKADVCDADKLCSSVCEPGTVKIAPWAARAISYQRNQSYDKSLCYTQLPATHNSATTLARGYGNRDQLFNQVLNATNANSYMRTNNQFLSIVDQLSIGARFIEIDAHYYGGALHSGHCSRVSVSLIDDASATLVSELQTILAGESSATVTVEWQSSLFGCLPSLSGIRAEEARLQSDTVEEVSSWIKANPTELVIVYTEIGTELAAFSKVDALLKLYEDNFGDLIFTPADLKALGGSWDEFTLSELIGKGKRVILVTTPTENALMFGMRSLCAGWSDSPGEKAYNSGSLVRVFESALHYATLSEDELSGDSESSSSSSSTPTGVTAATIPTFVSAGVNFVAPDGLDGATMKAMIWSWAEKEPSAGDVAVEISATNGRWYGVSDQSSIKNVACVSSSDRMSWKLVSQGSSCPSGFAVGFPQLAIENAALTAVLKASGSDATAQLDVDISAFPTISEADEKEFENSRFPSPFTSGSGESGGSSTPTQSTPASSGISRRFSGQCGSLWLAALAAMWIAARN